MEIKEAIEHLKQVRDNTSIPNYAKALDTAVRAMEELARIKAEQEGSHGQQNH